MGTVIKGWMASILDFLVLQLFLFKCHFVRHWVPQQQQRNDTSIQGTGLTHPLHVLFDCCDINVDDGGGRTHNLNATQFGFYCCLGMVRVVHEMHSLKYYSQYLIKCN